MSEFKPPQRTPEFDKLNFMVGEWKTRETHAPSPWLPKGGTGEGNATVRWGVGKLFLIQEYKSKGGLGSFEGFGLETYEADKKAYTHWWFDSMSTSGMQSHGHFEGTDLVFNKEMDTPMGHMKMKMITHPVSAKEFTFTIFMDQAGKWAESMKIQYVKA